jgi:2'-5' RNA ligase
MEDSFNEYNERISYMISQEAIRWKSGQLTPPTHRFVRGVYGDWEPVGHPGYTVITPTFVDESENIDTYARLGDVQHFLLKRLGIVTNAPAPVTAFHLTIADLVAGGTYTEKVQGSKQQQLLQALSFVFNQLALDGEIRLQVLGLSLFATGFIIAVVGAADASGYERLMLFRNAVYDDTQLCNLGVERKFKFTGHITLAYIEDVLSEQDRGRIAETLTAANRNLFAKPLPLEVVRAEIRKFDDMSAFYRQGGWPVFDFA